MQSIFAYGGSPSTLSPVDSAVHGGKRLERYIRTRWDRERGGIRGLALDAGISSDSLYKWFRGDSEPGLEGLGALARVLGVRRYELVAVYDGDRPPADLGDLLDPELRSQLVELIAHQVEKSLRDD